MYLVVCGLFDLLVLDLVLHGSLWSCQMVGFVNCLWVGLVLWVVYVWLDASFMVSVLRGCGLLGCCGYCWDCLLL